MPHKDRSPHKSIVVRRSKTVYCYREIERKSTVIFTDHVTRWSKNNLSKQSIQWKDNFSAPTCTKVSTSQLRHSGGASAVKEPGHFEVRTSSSQVTGTHFFPQKKSSTFCSSCRPQNTGRQCRYTDKIKQIKRSDMVTFLFSVHTKQSNTQR